MTVSLASLTAAGDLVDRNSYSTASISPTGSRLILVAVGVQRGGGLSPSIPTLSGNGITWTRIIGEFLAGGDGPLDERIDLFRGASASPSAGALTIDLAGITHTNCCWIVAEATGADLAQGDQGVRQAAVNDGDITTTGDFPMAVTLSAFGSVTNAAYIVGCVGVSSMTIAPPAGYTGIASTGAGQLLEFEADYLASQDTSPEQTGNNSFGTSNRRWAAIAIEIAELVAVAPTRKGVIGLGIGKGLVIA